METTQKTEKDFSSGYARIPGTNRVVSVGMPTRSMVNGPHRHTSDGPMADSVLEPVPTEMVEETPDGPRLIDPSA